MATSNRWSAISFTILTRTAPSPFTPGGMTEALKKLYGAQKLVDELLGQ